MNTLTQTIAISKEVVAEMPVVECPVDITVVDTPEMARVALRELSRSRVVGFDTETRPSFQRGRSFNVALMQLSTDDHCYLFRLNRVGISEHLRRFLEDPEITKIGLSVHDDFAVMRRVSGELLPQGFIDLQDYVKFFHINDISLQKIYAIVYGEKISKAQRLTNWEAEQLSVPQQKYAAIDAWACLRLYRTFRNGEFHPDESPYVIDRALLNPAQNNQLIGPHQAAEQAKATAGKSGKTAAEEKPTATRVRKKRTNAEPKAETAPKSAKSKASGKKKADSNEPAAPKNAAPARRRTRKKSDNSESAS